MDKIKKELLETAISLYGEIQPTANRKTLEECFTEEDSTLILWFNDKTGSTRTLAQEKNK